MKNILPCNLKLFFLFTICIFFHTLDLSAFIAIPPGKTTEPVTKNKSAAAAVTEVAVVQCGEIICQGQTGVIYTVPVITNATSYIWTLPFGATITAGANTNSITVDFSSSASSGNITAQGSNICGNGVVSDNFSVTINNCDRTDFFIPEGFSPNGDIVNDVFFIRGLDEYPLNSIAIYNRWGNKVYESSP